MSFRDFMQAALYEPGLGYYARSATRIGTAGDFYTSPHLHPLFGVALARQALECWGLMGRPAGFQVLEIGAGEGHLAKDFLDSTASAQMGDALRYVIVERNLYVQQRQAELLKPHAGKVSWAQSMSELEPFGGMVMTNELFDAMPVHLVEMTSEGLMEVHVTVEGEQFVEVLQSPCDDDIARHLSGIDLPVGYRTEVNFEAREFMKDISRALREGFILTIDYGYTSREYYEPERTRGTLMCYREHQINEDPLSHVGGQDITAHVDFSALKRWGEEQGLRALGYSSQGAYLVSLGIDELVSERYRDLSQGGRELAMLKGLLLPGGMGESHQVLMQYRGPGSPKLRGFTIRNHVGKL